MTQPDFSFNSAFHTAKRVAPPLRVAVLSDNDGLIAVAGRALQDTLACDFVALVAHVVANGKSDLGLAKHPYLMWIQHALLQESDPLGKVPIPSGCPTPKSYEWLMDKNGRVSLSATGLSWLQSLDLDVVLFFSAGLPSLDLCQAARHGVWRLQFGTCRDAPFSEMMLAEMITDHATIDVSLERWYGPDSSHDVLLSAKFPGIASSSFIAGRYGPVWSISHFVIEALQSLHGNGVIGPQADPLTLQSECAPRATYSAVSTWCARKAAYAAARRVKGAMDRALGRSRQLHWQIGLRKTETPLFEEPTAESVSQFRWLQSPRGRFWADPTLFEHNGSVWLFFEDWEWALGRARISVAELTDNGELGNVEAVLDRPYHLSFPQIIEDGAEIFMIPESSESGAVELWRSTVFPHGWTLECRLLDFPVVDPVVFRHSDRWWLMASPMPVNGHVAQTYLWFSDSLRGPWKLHPGGAICSDAGRSRAAGAVIFDGDRLFRPSQDCLDGYGRAVWFNEIQNISEQTYREKPLSRVTATHLTNAYGMHTFTRTSQWEAIDCRFWTSRTDAGD